MSAAQCLILGRMMGVGGWKPPSRSSGNAIKSHCLEPQNTGDDSVSTQIFSHQVICYL